MKKTINSPGGKMKLIILRYGKGPGILWIHGGGYAMGMASMVYYSMGRMLAKRYGGVVISPEYRLAKKAPYPAALEVYNLLFGYKDTYLRSKFIEILFFYHFLVTFSKRLSSYS